jgi:hypothetical protein
MSTTIQHQNTPTLTSSFRPRSCGYELDRGEFGNLFDSSNLLERTDLLRQKLEEDGYLYLPGFFKSEAVLEARKVVTDRLMEQGFLDKNHPSIDGIVSKVKIVNAKSAFRPKTGKENLEPVKMYNADDLTRQNRPLLDLLHKGKLIEFFEDFFGRPVRHYNYTWFRAVSPGLGTPPHCDWVYMSRGTRNLLTTWMPVGNAHLDLGGLMILEGSHKKSDRLQNYLSRDVDEYCVNGMNARKIESGEMLYEWDGTLSENPASLREKLGGRWLTAEFNAGDILIFTMRTVHASLDNQSNRVRLSVDTRYQPADEPFDERYMVENPVPYATKFKKGRIC